VLVFIIFLLTGCQVSKGTTNNENTYSDELIHFLEWNGYLGYYEDEIPHIQFLFLINNEINQNIIEDIKSISLVDNNGKDYKVNSWKIIDGKERDLYSLKTISIQFPPFKVGTTYLKNISITFNKNQILMWPIGKILVDTREGSNPTILDIGKKTSLTVAPAIDWYQVELKNNHTRAIEIQGLEVNIPDRQFNIYPEVFKDFSTKQKIIKNPLLLNSQQKQTFRFNFETEEKQIKGFHIIRPFVTYKTKNGEVFKQTLGLAGYTPRLSIEQAKEYLNLK
jgi:hypothetical protein